MGAIKAKEHIWYVGVQDPDLRVFDIIMHSDYGTSYNAYLVQGTEKTVLFETSKAKFFDEFLDNIRQVTDPAKIDYIVVDHTEPDHTGSMEKLLELAPNATVLGSGTAITFEGDRQPPVQRQGCFEKDRIDLGGLTLTFLSVPMLHWPDSMYTYIPELKALFTCDSFGCHYADERVFNDLIEGDFTEAYKYYFDNIIGPFKNPFMLRRWTASRTCPSSLWATDTDRCCAATSSIILICTAPGARPSPGQESGGGGLCVCLRIHPPAGRADLQGPFRKRRRGEVLRSGQRRQRPAAKAAIADADGFFAGQPHTGGRRAAPGV